GLHPLSCSTSDELPGGLCSPAERVKMGYAPEEESMRHWVLPLVAALATAHAVDAHAFCLSPFRGTVRINSQILIDGVARPGVRVKVPSSVFWAGASLLGFDFPADIDTYTDANGRIAGSYFVCGPLLLLRFAFRSDYNGDTKTYGIGEVSWSFNKTINFTGSGA